SIPTIPDASSHPAERIGFAPDSPPEGASDSESCRRGGQFDWRRRERHGPGRRYGMIRRRTAEAGFKIKLGCHVFRATGITAYLEAGGTLKRPRPWPRTIARAPPSS